MPFRGLFLPSHLLPSNLRPLLIFSCGDHKRIAVSLLQVLVLQQACSGKRLHCIASFKPRPSTCERMNRCPSAFQNTTTRLSTMLLPSNCTETTCALLEQLKMPSHAKYELSTYQALSGLQSTLSSLRLI
jgi:hypothetical protein